MSADGTSDPEIAPAAGASPAPAPAPKRVRQMMRAFELVERVKAYDPDADEDLINRA